MSRLDLNYGRYIQQVLANLPDFLKKPKSMKRNEPKFKRGNLVRVLVGHLVYGGPGGVTDISPQDVGSLAIIDYVYWDAYGFMYPEESRSSHLDDYSIIFLETGHSLAWKRTEELEFLEEGGEHLFKIATNPTFKDYKKEILAKYASKSPGAGK